MTDYSEAARARVRTARARTGMSPAAFVEALSDLLDWDLEPGIFRAWENGHGTPTGDVLLAAEELGARSGKPPRLEVVR